ncbi:MAG: DegT/DnrJ/EryC1/StrS family aminotransferase [Candidatus Omnitrophota bacterium]|jgi:dTDP-4-amino-4,6-dideoxygalactose transaminase
MITKIPIIGAEFDSGDLMYALRHSGDELICNEFSFAVSLQMQEKYVYLVSSGIASLYLALMTLRQISGKREVVLPAYTAGSLVVAVKKAGLKPVLCDISMDDFNADIESLSGAVSENTLAVVCVHMFGIGMQSVSRIREKIPSGVFIIEDCAQAMGSKVQAKPVGSFSDISFLSFNRGKNLAAHAGGAIMTNNKELAEISSRLYAELSKQEGIWRNSNVAAKTYCFGLAVNPFWYGLGFPLISLFKSTRPPRDFSIEKIPNFQAGLGLMLLKKADTFFTRRHHNGMRIIEALQESKGIIVPHIASDARPVFNRLPVVFKDINKVEEVRKRLWRAGIEASRMYLMPLHHMFELGYESSAFPHASYLAARLLTLPVHPGVPEDLLLKMIYIIGEAVSK